MLLSTLAAAAADHIQFKDLGLDKVALNLGFFEIKWYSLAYIAGILVGWWYLLRLLRQPGAPMSRRHADDLVFYATLGIILGRAAQLGLTAPRLRWLDLAAVTFLVFAWLVKIPAGNPTGIAAFNDWFDSVQLGSDKTNLAWSRLLHLGALAWLVIRWLPAEGRLARSRVGRALACSGRNSLHVFCVGIVLAIIGQIVLAETSFALDVQLLLCAGGVTVLTGLGIFLSWYRSITTRDQRAEPAEASAASAPRPSFSPR